MAKSLIAPVPEVYEPIEGLEKKLNPVIFMHAMLCSKEIWGYIPQWVANRTRRMVYTYDARCHGENKDDGKEFSFEDLVEDLYQYMDEKGIRKAILVGHSMGGITAIEAALKQGAKVEMVFILDMYIKPVPKVLVERSIEFMMIWAKTVRDLEGIPEEEVTVTSVPQLFKNLPADMQSQSEEEGYLNSTFRYIKTDGRYDVCFNTDALCEGLKLYIENYDQQKITIGEYVGPAFFIYGTKSPFEVHNEKAQIKAHFPAAEMIPFTDAPHHIFAKTPVALFNILINKINNASCM